MEGYLKELIDACKQQDGEDCDEISIDVRGELLTFEAYNVTEHRHLIERFFFTTIDRAIGCAALDVMLNHLYAGDYVALSTNVKSYLFETLELCSPRQLLPWILRTLDNEDEMLDVNIQAFTAYVDAKRKRGSTNGEIRYTILCESSTKLLELVLSKIARDRLTSKQVWLAVFRLKQHLCMTSVQKDIFNDWLGVV